MNKAAQALGRLGKGKAKHYSKAELAKRTDNLSPLFFKVVTDRVKAVGPVSIRRYVEYVAALCLQRLIRLMKGRAILPL